MSIKMNQIQKDMSVWISTQTASVIIVAMLGLAFVASVFVTSRDSKAFRRQAANACRVSWEVCETSRGGQAIPPTPDGCAWRKGPGGYEFAQLDGRACDWDDSEFTADADGLDDTCVDALNACQHYLEERP